MDNRNEWDELIEKVSERQKTEIHPNINSKNSNSNQLNQRQQSSNFNLSWLLGVAGIIILFVFVILPMFGGGGSGSYRLKSARFEVKSTTRYEYYAIIENTSSNTHSYRVTLEIYTPRGALYDSISDYYTLQSGGTGTVWFIVNVPAGYYGSYKVNVTVT